MSEEIDDDDDDDGDCYDPTEAESEVISRAALTAAWDALKPIEDCEKNSTGVVAVLHAFKVAEEAVKKGKKQLLASHPEFKYVSYYESITLIVCSALNAVGEYSLENVAPQSIGGARIVMLCQAVKILESVAQIEMALDDDYGLIGESSGGLAAEIVKAKFKL